jgi:hypothetical protein
MDFFSKFKETKYKKEILKKKRKNIKY